MENMRFDADVFLAQRKVDAEQDIRNEIARLESPCDIGCLEKSEARLLEELEIVVADVPSHAALLLGESEQRFRTLLKSLRETAKLLKLDKLDKNQQLELERLKADAPLLLIEFQPLRSEAMKLVSACSNSQVEELKIDRERVVATQAGVQSVRDWVQHEKCPLTRLPPIQPAAKRWMSGPLSTCNFVLPGRLLSGSYPGDRKEPEHSMKVKALLDAGVDTFVCLQLRSELRRFTPYMKTAHELSANPDSLEFWHCPIPDCSVTTDEELAKGVATIVDRLQSGRTIYVHCWGGHGRTGTVICSLLVWAYGLTTQQAAAHFMVGESARRDRRGHWPHGQQQYEQVQRSEAELRELSSERLPPLQDWADT